MSPQALFDSWVATHNAIGRDPLSEASAEHYRVRWMHWTRWLAEARPRSRHPRAAHFLDATSDLVREFLDTGRSEASLANSRNSGPFSPTTRRRYWRTLKRIYAHAAHKGLVATNPVDEHGAPAPEDRDSTVVSALVLDATPKVLPKAKDWWHVRDRALLLVMLDTAMTPAELCGLVLAQVESDLQGSDRLRLNLEGKRRSQHRSLTLKARGSKALSEWLFVRQGLAVHGAFEDDARDRVFVTEGEAKGIYTPAHFYPLVRRTLEAAREYVGLRAKLPAGHVDDDASQYSPMVIRNSILLLRLQEGHDAAVVIYEAGFKDHRALRGLTNRLSEDRRAKILTEIKRAK